MSSLEPRPVHEISAGSELERSDRGSSEGTVDRLNEAPRFPRPTTLGQVAFIRALYLLESSCEAFPEVNWRDGQPGTR